MVANNSPGLCSKFVDVNDVDIEDATIFLDLLLFERHRGRYQVTGNDYTGASFDDEDD